LPLADRGPHRFPVVVNANVPGNRVKPWKRRFTRAIGVPHLVNAKPGFLQQVICIRTALRLRIEKSMELRADALDNIRGRIEIAPLIASHQRIEIAVRVHGFECLPAINISTSMFAQLVPGREAPSQTYFDPILTFSMEGARKLREGK
jgi:hypothetical protein